MTEFTEVGLHCSAENCNQQDFLPFTCDCCNGECVTLPFLLFFLVISHQVWPSLSCSYPAAVPTAAAAAAAESKGIIRSVDRLVKV